MARNSGTCPVTLDTGHLTVDETTDRLYCSDAGGVTHDLDLEGDPGVLRVWDMRTGRPLGHFDLGPYPSPANPIGALGIALVAQSARTSIVAPAVPLPSAPLPRAPRRAVFFSQTHHALAGAFLAFFQRYGGVPTFGYPQTEPFTEDGRLVQYTDRFVLAQERGHVSTVPLDRILVAPRSWQATPRPGPGIRTRRYFAATGHTLSGRFLAYWQAHHGDVLLGRPISEPFMEGNDDGSGRRYLLQWFENGRLEYHAELAGTPYAMEVGLTGLLGLTERGWHA